MLDFENYPIIAAVRTEEDLLLAAKADIDTIFLLGVDLIDIERFVTIAHQNGKKIFVHIDFVHGLANDTSGVKYIATKGVDGVISTRSGIISAANDCGLATVQRFFMIDSRSVETALETLKSSRTDMVEIMPGIAYKAIERIKIGAKIPIIAGGLIEQHDEAIKALSAGASMVSTGTHALWGD